MLHIAAARVTTRAAASVDYLSASAVSCLQVGVLYCILTEPLQQWCIEQTGCLGSSVRGCAINAN
jgi:hypothetical protein